MPDVSEKMDVSAVPFFTLHKVRWAVPSLCAARRPSHLCLHPSVLVGYAACAALVAGDLDAWRNSHICTLL